MTKKDGELSSWLIVGGLFTALLTFIDIRYSSFGLMSLWLRIPLFIAHAAIIVLWVAEMIHFNDPNYDLLRRIVVILSVILSLTVGIHHSLSVEDKQVIIDSKENALIDSLKAIGWPDSAIKLYKSDTTFKINNRDTIKMETGINETNSIITTTKLTKAYKKYMYGMHNNLQ